MRGVRFSVRLPRRMVAIWVRLPMGLASPRRAASTPATKVVATAPKPGRRTPSLPLAGRISDGCFTKSASFALVFGDQEERMIRLWAPSWSPRAIVSFTLYITLSKFDWAAIKRWNTGFDCSSLAFSS